jgi:hypothetical protein
MDLNKVILKPDEKKTKEDTLVAYLSATRGQHNVYAYRYFICEVLNFFNVIIQMVSFFVNLFQSHFYQFRFTPNLDFRKLFSRRRIF